MNCFCGGSGKFTDYNCGASFEVMCPHCQGTGVKKCTCSEAKLRCSQFGRGHEIFDDPLQAAAAIHRAKERQMTFGEAIEALKQGKSVARAGWNGKNMHLYLQKSVVTAVSTFEPCIVMYTAQGKHQPGWLASQTDMLAEDWSVIAS